MKIYEHKNNLCLFVRRDKLTLPKIDIKNEWMKIMCNNQQAVHIKCIITMCWNQHNCTQSSSDKHTAQTFFSSPFSFLTLEFLSITDTVTRKLWLLIPRLRNLSTWTLLNWSPKSQDCQCVSLPAITISIYNMSLSSTGKGHDPTARI